MFNNGIVVTGCILWICPDFEILKEQRGFELVIAGSLAAFLGAFIGARLLKKITMCIIQTTVGVMLLLLAIALALGVI